VNLVAVLYGGLMVVNMAWPRAAVYDPAGGHWYLQFFALLFVAAVLAVGALVTRGRTGALGTAPAQVTA
jgi:hypothetical protein